MDKLRLWGCGFALAAIAWPAPALAAKIACVGDSITYGYGLSNPTQQSYPALLQTLLGSQHSVKNFGTSGCTLLKKGDKPYWNDANFGASDAFKPDVVVVMLGTNDAKPQNWSRKADFAGDYASLIDHYRGLGAQVYMAAPPPVYPPGAFDIPPDVVANEVVPLVRQIATDAGTPIVDVFKALSGKAGNFPDKVHPDAAGAQIIADTVAAALQSGGFGGAGGTSTGGASGTGGATGSGGAAGSGGASGSGGKGGGTGSGGVAASGGASAGTGGSSASGGNLGSGGTPRSSGGATTLGGATGSGGSPQGSGGAPTSSGGGIGSGGSASSAGGSSAPGGSSGKDTATTSAGTGGTNANAGGSTAGCGCGVLGRLPVGGRAASLLFLFALVALARCARGSGSSSRNTSSVSRARSP